MEVFVPTENRLLCAFVLAKDLRRLTAGTSDESLAKYAIVQVPRRGEYMDCEASDFKEVVDEVKDSFGDILGSSFKEAEDGFNRRMASLGLDEARLGQPAHLGRFFCKQDAYGFGMITTVMMGGETATMAMGGALLRVKKRLLFVYLYAEYRDEDTIRWLRRATEEWSDTILGANL